MLINLNFISFFFDNVLSILLLNVFTYVYLILNLFTIILLFDVKFLKTLNELKFFGDFKRFSSSLLNVFLSLAGIPPLLGFCSKFILFIFLFEKFNLFFIIVYSLFNIFVIYFYIQNFRFLSTNKVFEKFLRFKLNIKNYFIFYSLSFFQFFNFFGIFFISEVLNVFNLITLFFIF